MQQESRLQGHGLRYHRTRATNTERNLSPDVRCIRDMKENLGRGRERISRSERRARSSPRSKRDPSPAAKSHRQAINEPHRCLERIAQYRHCERYRRRSESHTGPATQFHIDEREGRAKQHKRIRNYRRFAGLHRDDNGQRSERRKEG